MSRIKVHVTAFWLEKETRAASGLRKLDIEIPEGGRISDLMRILQERYPGVSAEEANYVLNNTLTLKDEVLREGDHLAIFPPLMGG